MTAATRTRASTPSTCSDGLMPKSTCVRGGRDGPVSQGTWLVSLNRWTAANSRPYHWISLMQAEPRYSR